MAKAKFDTSFSFGANAAPAKPKSGSKTPQSKATKGQYAQARRKGGQLHGASGS